MSEKLLELSSVVDVLSRTVADLEKQRQLHQVRSAVVTALMHSIVESMPPEQRARVAEAFAAAGATLLALSTPAGRTALERELADMRSRVR
ncbi:MAG TPA: hypothetical protein VM074_12735 [Solimonas sp.]|nr:hypothetical protein [Solimonas sp.]